MCHLVQENTHFWTVSFVHHQAYTWTQSERWGWGGLFHVLQLAAMSFSVKKVTQFTTWGLLLHGACMVWYVLDVSRENTLKLTTARIPRFFRMIPRGFLDGSCYFLGASWWLVQIPSGF